MLRRAPHHVVATRRVTNTLAYPDVQIKDLRSAGLSLCRSYHPVLTPSPVISYNDGRS